MYHTIGAKYEETKDLDIKEIAKLVRADIKKEFPDIKTSVTIERYSMGQSLNVRVTESDTQLKNYSYDHTFKTNPQGMTERGKEVKQGITNIVEAYNFDDSDSMSDYYHVRFHSSIRFEC